MILIVLVLPACAGARPPAGTPQEPVPPPKGAPSPRLDPAPDPAPAPGAQETAEARFPVLEGKARREQRQRHQQTIEESLEVLEGLPADACAGITPTERLNCPFKAEAIAALEDVPRGIRLHFRAGAVQPDRLRQVVLCQTALARGDPNAPPVCPFFRGETQKVVQERRGRVMVDLIDPDEVGAGVLRERVEVAFPRAAR